MEKGVLAISNMKLEFFWPPLEMLTVIKEEKLPNLSHLELMVPQQSLQTEQVFQALESVRTNLKSLSILGMGYTGHLGSEVTYLRFPLMEGLEKLEVSAMNCELEEDTSELQLALPKLREIILTSLTFSMFQKWTQSFASSTVVKVSVHVVSVSSSGNDVTTCSLDWVGMRALHRSFPNVTSLSISVDPVETSGFHYIFQEMTKLTELTVEAVHGTSELGEDFWDGLLIGAKESTVETLKLHPQCWQDVEIAPRTKPSIRNLKNLQSLSLWEKPPTESPSLEFPDPEPLITDVSFYFAFVKMTNLRSLHFRGGFQVPENTMMMWRRTRHDRTIISE